MEKARSCFPWIVRYCERTLQLVPTLPGPVAVKWAVSGFPYCGDAEPDSRAYFALRQTSIFSKYVMGL